MCRDAALAGDGQAVARRRRPRLIGWRSARRHCRRTPGCRPTGTWSWRSRRPRCSWSCARSVPSTSRSRGRCASCGSGAPPTSRRPTSSWSNVSPPSDGGTCCRLWPSAFVVFYCVSGGWPCFVSSADGARTCSADGARTYTDGARTCSADGARTYTDR